MTSRFLVRAARARWGNKPLSASHKGNFKEKFGVDVECYVLDDAGKTAVISQTGMARALGLAPRGSVFPKFIASQAMAESVGTELRGKVENPLKFQWSAVGTGTPPVAVNGFDAGLLIDICNAIISAEVAGRLKGGRYDNVIKQAHIIVGASAKSGIRQLVYALAGYNPSVEEVIAAFKAYVLERAGRYSGWAIRAYIYLGLREALPCPVISRLNFCVSAFHAAAQIAPAHSAKSATDIRVSVSDSSRDALVISQQRNLGDFLSCLLCD